MADELDLEAIEARAEAATSGPWRLWDGWGPTEDGLMGFARLGPEAGDRVFVHDDQRDLYARRGDAEFIAHARADVPALVAEVRRLRGQRARLDDLCEEYRKREESQGRIHERLRSSLLALADEWESGGGDLPRSMARRLRRILEAPDA